MINSSITFSSQKDGAYRIRSEVFTLDAKVEVPQFSDRTALEFSKAQSVSGEIGGIAGTVISDVAEADEVEIVREFFVGSAGELAGVRIKIRNRGDRDIALNKVHPLVGAGRDALRLEGIPFKDWMGIRLSRQKNEIPGAFSFAEEDDDWDDASFNAQYVVAGVGSMDGDNDVSKAIHTSCCIFLGEKGSRQGLVMAVLGEQKNLTDLSFTPSKDRRSLHAVTCTCPFDQVLVTPGEDRETHWLLFYGEEDKNQVFDRYADLCIQEFNLVKPHKDPLTVYCTWQTYGFDFRKEDLVETLESLKRNPIPVDVIQLDNGWIDYLGDWGPNHRFPGGLEEIATMIKSAGYRAGIWTCPLVIMEMSRMYRDHPELVARRIDGSLAEFPYGEEGRGKVYIVDPTVPYFEEYIHNLYGKLADWGFDYHKLDFMRAVINDDEVVFHNRKMNRAEAYGFAMKTIRKAMGEGAYFASCGGLSGVANAGFADALRTSSDTYGDWIKNGVRRLGALVRVKQNLVRSFTNKYWNTDPDSVLLRRRREPWSRLKTMLKSDLSTGTFTNIEVNTLITHQYLAGGNVCISDRFAELDEDRRELYKRFIPSIGRPARILDYDEPNLPNCFFTEIDAPWEGGEPWWTLAVGNWSDSARVRTIDVSNLPFPDDLELGILTAFELIDLEFLGLCSREETLSLEIPAHGIKVVRFAPWSRSKPQIVGTDMHLSGGAVELRSVEIGEKAIRGAINNPWDYALKIYALFPMEDTEKLVARSFDSNEREFSISL